LDLKGRTHVVGVCENKILMNVSGTEREEVMGRLRKLYAEELHDMYC